MCSRDVFLFWLAAVGSLTVASTVEADPVEADPVESPLVYRLSGSLDRDSCGQRISLVADFVTLYPDGGMHVDVVNRNYQVQRRDGYLLAEGHFRGGGCAGSRTWVSWRLRPGPSRTLVGTIDSRWRLEPDCRECDASFTVRLTPVRR